MYLWRPGFDVTCYLSCFRKQDLSLGTRALENVPGVCLSSPLHAGIISMHLPAQLLTEVLGIKLRSSG